MQSSSTANDQRRNSRTKAVFPVRVKGKDSSGAPFEELAHTLDVAATGLRLGAVRRELKVDDEVTIFYRQRRIQYRVIWTKRRGTSEFQVGLQAVMQEGDGLGIRSAESKAPAAAEPVVSSQAGLV